MFMYFDRTTLTSGNIRLRATFERVGGLERVNNVDKVNKVLADLSTRHVCLSKLKRMYRRTNYATESDNEKPC